MEIIDKPSETKNAEGYLLLVDSVSSTKNLISSNEIQPGGIYKSITDYFELSLKELKEKYNPVETTLITYTGDGYMILIEKINSAVILEYLIYLERNPLKIENVILKFRTIVHYGNFKITTYKQDISTVFPPSDALILYKLEKTCPSDCFLLTGLAYAKLKEVFKKENYTIHTASIPQKLEVFNDQIPNNIYYVSKNEGLSKEVENLSKKIEGYEEEMTKIVLREMKWTEEEKKELPYTKVIITNCTEKALFELIDVSKEAGYSIEAICGIKGDYSGNYYSENVKKFNCITRLFSFAAIKYELKKRKEAHSLIGLRDHLTWKREGKNIKVYLIERSKKLKDLSGNHKFPLTFGMAMVIDRNDNPVKCVVHWERTASETANLLAIEGFIFNDNQMRILKRLRTYYNNLLISDRVIKNENEKTIQDRYLELEKIGKELGFIE